MSEILHFGIVQLRITGSGNIKGKLYSLSDTQTFDLPTLAMAATSNKVSTLLANFNQQKAALEFKTTEIDEKFKISKIVIHIIPVATSYPQ